MTTIEDVKVKPRSAASTQWKTLRDLIYPVGSYYISYKKDSPADLFGGQWNKVTNRFLYTADGTVDFTPGYTFTLGGSNDAIVPAHTHDISQQPEFSISGTVSSHNHSFTGTAASHNHTFSGTAANHNHTYNHDHDVTVFDSGADRYFPSAQAGYGWETGGAISGTGYVYPRVATGNNHQWTSNPVQSLANTYGTAGEHPTSTATLTPAGSISSTSITPSGTIGSTAPTFSGSASRTKNVVVKSTGDSATGANMPAYQKVFCWYRTS